MKIVHTCLAVPYIEGFGYQENILTQFHAKMGHKVTILTSEKIFNSKYEPQKREIGEYVNDYGIHVKVLPKSKRYGYYSRFGDFDGVYSALEDDKPDIIFVHGGQFVALKDILKYCKQNKAVKLYIDQHGDYYNMPINTWKRKIVQYYIFGHWMRKAIPVTQKFWGVTPWRCQYLHDVYKIPQNKVDLLVMAGDDRYIHSEQMPQLQNDIRTQLDLTDNDFVVITGGKIDSTKNIHLLMKAIIELNIDNLKLIVFGQPNDEMEPIIANLAEDKHIRNIGWLDSTKVYDYFLSSDLAVFPGTHSVLWEQACACGIPGLFKDWVGMHHVNVNGNVEFLCQDSVEEIKTKIYELYKNNEKYSNMKNKAVEAANEFSYMHIARKSIEVNS